MKKIQISPSILSADFSQLGNEIKRLEIKMYGKVVTTNDKWATTNWGTRVSAVEKTKAQAQAYTTALKAAQQDRKQQLESAMGMGTR